MLFILGGIGFAGVCNACREAFHHANHVVLAMLFAGAIYRAAMPFLWFFADPMTSCSACGMPAPSARPADARDRCYHVSRADYRSAGVSFSCRPRIISSHDAENSDGNQRAAGARNLAQAIDAGYSLNGHDLYIYPAQSVDNARDEPRIPLITTPTTLPYVISTSPI